MSMPAAVTKAMGGLPKMEWKTPRDKKEFVGCLVGGRQETRREIAEELIKRYGIRVTKHFGSEVRKTPGSIFVPPQIEVVVFLADDLQQDDRADIIVKKLMECTRAGGQTLVGINRKQKHTWDRDLAAHGFSNPPKWNLIPNIADPDMLEAQRKAELAALEAPRMARVDPALPPTGLATIGDKLKLVQPDKKAAVEEIVNQYLPAKNGAVKPAPAPAPAAATPGRKRSAPGTGPRDSKGREPGKHPFGKIILEVREKKGVSQSVAARESGVHVTNLCSYEMGKTIPQYEMWLKLCAYYGPLPEPEGMKGKRIYKIRHGGKLADMPKLTAKQAFGATPAPPVAAAPVVETPAPPPPAPAPALPKHEPVVFIEHAIAAPSDQEERITVNLKAGGSLTLVTSVKLTKLKGEDRKFVFAVIDMLQEYEEKKE